MAEAFNIDIPKSDLVDLQHRLARTRLPDQLEGTSWEYGTDLNYVKVLLSVNVRQFESTLTKLPHPFGMCRRSSFGTGRMTSIGESRQVLDVVVVHQDQD